MSTPVAWLMLIVAGLLEIAWALGLKASQGWTRPGISAVTILAMIASFLLLGRAAKSIPIGTAYAVWVGIGAAGVAVAGMVIYREPASATRIFFIVLAVVAVVGLALSSPPEPAPAPAPGSSAP